VALPLAAPCLLIKGILVNKILFAFALICFFMTCSNPLKSYEDEIKSGFDFINSISDTTYIVYNDGEVMIESSPFRGNNDPNIYINTAIIAKQKADNQNDFYHYLSGCKTIYSFSEDTVFILNQYSYNPDGGYPIYSSTIEVDPPYTHSIKIEKR
jgi:hypothetical protein